TLARLYGSVDAEISQCVKKAEAAKGKNRATVVTLNAEIRRAKAKLLEEDLPKLQCLTLKKVLVVRSNLRLIIRVMAPPHPVHVAAHSGDLDCIRKLLAWGADRLQRDSAGGELDPCHEAQGEEGHREGKHRRRPDICRERHPHVRRAHELPPPRPIRP
uniref:Uncharacterized protein n=1 Tax=Triticum urartu TaxID=4572 RepID=A0A8R7U223_TRIUA